LVAVHDDDGCILLDREEFPQPNKTAEALAQLQPALVTVYKPKLDEAGTTYAALVRQAYPDICINHVHTAGTSSGVVDGAGALLLASPEYARAHNFKPRARIRALVHWSLPVQIRRLC
jgi:acetyl-CoA C-acetyltransferase